MRTCSACKETKEDELFIHRKGKPTLQCRACNKKQCKKWHEDNKQAANEYQRNWAIRNEGAQKRYNQTRKEKWRIRMQEHLDYFFTEKSKPCSDCGKSFHPVAMDFDHVLGEKRYEVASMISAGCSLEALKAEIAKCELVCACCHRIRTHNRKGNPGPYSKYFRSIKTE